MKKNIIKNAIITDGVVHELVTESSFEADCDKCSLHDKCVNCENNTSFCQLLDSTSGAELFRSIGTLEEVNAREDERQRQRHLIAVLRQYYRWVNDTDSDGFRVRRPLQEDINAALEFAFTKLKEVVG